MPRRIQVRRSSISSGNACTSQRDDPYKYRKYRESTIDGTRRHSRVERIEAISKRIIQKKRIHCFTKIVKIIEAKVNCGVSPVIRAEFFVANWYAVRCLLIDREKKLLKSIVLSLFLFHDVMRVATVNCIIA